MSKNKICAILLYIIAIVGSVFAMICFAKNSIRIGGVCLCLVSLMLFLGSVYTIKYKKE